MFSIVMPLWNKRHTLAATVATVLDQSWRDFELVVVDDGSTDGGAALLAGFGDPRIRTLAQANAGPGAARNAGIAAARHDWIAFLDADDLWLPDHLAELDRVRRLFPDAGLIGTAFVRRGRDELDPPAGPDPPVIATIDYFERQASGAPALHTSTAAIPRTTHEALGGFVDHKQSEDSEYWARIALELPVATSSRVTAIYRLDTGGITDQSRKVPRYGTLRALSDLGPEMALLAERRPGIESARRREAIDRYVDYRLGLSVRIAAREGDVASLRAFPGLYPRPPRPDDRLILAIARLPIPLARALYGFGFRAKALLRRLKRRVRHAD
ncbi:MAG TPA: glycosyltransferase [Allosphingosinicella sp.]|nr:glycosyltransferase [Allosphingosinicella sp.]